MAIPELYGCKADFWDLWNERGVATVKNVLANAQVPGWCKHA